jgi:O-antigen/teichoic acid export membrane protein
VQILYFFLARGLPALIGLASIAVYTKLLVPAEYGILSICVVVGTCVNLGLFHWLQAGIQRLYPHYDHRARSNQLLGVLLLAYPIYLAVVLLCAALVIASAAFTYLRPQVILACAALAMLLPAFESNLALAIARSDSASYALLAGGRASLALGAGLLLIYGLGPIAENAVWGLCIGLFLATSIFGYRVWFGGRWDINSAKPVAQELLRYGGPMSLALLFSYLTVAADRLLIGTFLGATAVGLYVAGYDLVHQAVSAVMGTISMAIAPHVYRSHAAGRIGQTRSNLSNLLLWQVAIGVPLAVLLLVAAPRLCALLLGGSYAAASVIVVQLIAISALLSNMRAFYFDMAFHIALRTDLILRILALVAIINVAANLVLIPIFGVVAAGYAAILSHAVGLLMSILIGRSVHRIPLWSANLGKIFVAVAVMLLLYFALEANLQSLHWITNLALSLTAYACLMMAAFRFSTQRGPESN